MVYWFAAGIGPPAIAYTCYYLWRSGTETQLRSMGLSESTDETAFSGVVAGVATLIGTYGAVSSVIGPMVSAPKKKVLPGQQAKVESLSEFARLAGPATIVRGAGLFLGFDAAGSHRARTLHTSHCGLLCTCAWCRIYAAGRVKTWLSCRHLEPKAAEPKASPKAAEAKAKGTRAAAKDKQRERPAA